LDEWGPTFSPDGSKIAYTQGNFRDVFTMPATGGTPTNVTSDYGEYSEGVVDWGVSTKPPTDDTAAPIVTKAPTQSLISNSSLSTSKVRVKLDWLATDDSSTGVACYQLYESVDGGAYRKVPLASEAPASIVRFLEPGKTYQYQLRAQDQAGNWSEWKQAPPFKVNVFQETNGAIEYAGNWSTQSISSAMGGSLKHASTTGDSAKLALSGVRNIGWVTAKGPDRGKAEVWVDGAKVSTPDLYSSPELWRRVAYAKNGMNTSVNHTLEVKVLGQKRWASSGTRVDLDALVVLSKP